MTGKARGKEEEEEEVILYFVLRLLLSCKLAVGR